MDVTDVWDGLLTPTRLVEALAPAPAKLGGFDAGTLSVGSEADIAVLDPEARWTVAAGALHSRSSNTPFLGQEVTGRNTLTIVGGKVVYEP